MLLQKHYNLGVLFIVFTCVILLSFKNSLAESQGKFSKKFFKEVPPIAMEDRLAAVLGAVDPGEVFLYNYEDAVKLAGHSCLAISGAYRLTQIALNNLYGDQTPVRGEIEVIFKGSVDFKVNGPISQVVTLITGAAGENGFKGLKGEKFKRYNLLRFDTNSNPPAGAVCSVIFTRIDTGRMVEISYTNSMLPPLPDMQEMVRLVLSGEVENMFKVTERYRE